MTREAHPRRHDEVERESPRLTAPKPEVRERERERAGRGREEAAMGRVFTVELDGRIYRCRHCRTHLAVAEDLISRSFHCQRGKAYLFNTVSNISLGDQVERMMLSGMHTISEIFCCFCGQNVGWKYEAAHENSQKYKEGKFVLERGRIVDAIDAEFFIDLRASEDEN